MSFMSGLTSGFMSTFGAGGGFGAIGGAGGAAGAAGASGATGATDASAASSLGESSSAAATASTATGTPTAGGAASAAGQVSPSTDVGGTSMGASSMTPSSNGIIQNNPFGAAPKASPTAGDYFKAAAKGAQQGSQAVGGSQRQDTTGQVSMPNNTYAALFGSATQVGEYGGGQIGVQRGEMQPVQIQPTQTSAPPPMPPPQAPQPMQLPPPTVSDVRAKYKIQNAQKNVDALLQRVYDNVTKRKS
jgi:pilus assembly protein FimV